MWMAVPWRYVASGTISTTHIEKDQLPARLKVLFDGIREVVARYTARRRLGRDCVCQRQSAKHPAAGSGAWRSSDRAGVV
jgi:hypothetical protein